jgi:DNA-binding GntR family transcriptional regulator
VVENTDGLVKHDGSGPVSEDGSFADKAYRTLEEMITTLELEPGSLVSEAALSDILQIGRTPVREALKRLEYEHLVEILPRRGIRVSTMHVEDQLLQIEVRRELERLIAVLAARRATPEERAELAEMADEIETAAASADELRVLRISARIHAKTMECARNPFVTTAITPLRVLARRFWFLHNRREATSVETVREHGRLLRAISRGDEAEASAAADSVMDAVATSTEKVVLDLFRGR